MLQENKFLNEIKNTKKLRDLCKYMFIRSYNERETIFEEGSVGDTFFIIHAGKVTVYKSQKTEVNESAILRRVIDLSPGDSFGELALLHNEPRAATIIATEPTWLITLDKTSYMNIIKVSKVN